MTKGESGNPMTNSHTEEAAQADYLMLTDLVKFHHDRLVHHTTMFMSILSALSGFIVWFIAENTRLTVFRKYELVLLAATCGFMVSVAWFFVLRRILEETRLRYFQLCYCERVMKRPYGLFTEGRRFFEKDIYVTKTSEPREEKLELKSLWAKLPVKITLQCLASGYALFNLVFVAVALLKIIGSE